MKTLYQRIRMLRINMGLNQSELADKIGVTKSAVSQWESGKRNPDKEALLSLADLFNVDLNYLYGKEDVTSRYLKYDEILLIDKYRSASAEIKSAINAILGINPEPADSNDASA